MAEVITRTTFSLDDDLLSRARSLGVNVSAAARSGVEAAVRRAAAEQDRAAYERHPEGAESRHDDTAGWDEAEAWSDG